MAKFSGAFSRLFAIRNINNLGFPANDQTYGPLLRICRWGSLWEKQPKMDVEPRQFEISRDPEEWKFVDRLLSKPTVPPLIQKDLYPSGWVPPTAHDVTNLPYFVNRTKNHMLPLYINHEDRGQRKVTVLKNINGDIWKLHAAIKQHVEDMRKKKIPSQILECNSIIKFKGDHYHYIEQFLLSKGF